MEEKIWVFIPPEWWGEGRGQEEIKRLAEVWGVVATPTGKPHNWRYGLEQLYIVTGRPEAIMSFKKDINIAFQRR